MLLTGLNEIFYEEPLGAQKILLLSLSCPSLFLPPCLFFNPLCYPLLCTAFPEWSSWNSICTCLLSWSQISNDFPLPGVVASPSAMQDSQRLAPPSFPRFISYCSGTHTGTSPVFLSVLLPLPRPPRGPFLALPPWRRPFLLHGSLPSLISNFTYCPYQFLFTEATTSRWFFESISSLSVPPGKTKVLYFTESPLGQQWEWEPRMSSDSRLQVWAQTLGLALAGYVI